METPLRDSQILQGHTVSPGVAVGPLLVVGFTPGVDFEEPQNVDVQEALLRVDAAMEAVAEHLEARQVYANVEGRAILEANAMMARDAGLRAAIQRQLEKGSGVTAAVAESIDAFAAQFLDVGGFMADRIEDLYDVRNRVIAHLRGAPQPGVPRLDTPSVLAAADLAPSDTAILDPATCLGIVTWKGGPTGHTAILAEQLGIPTIVQVTGLHAVPSGTTVALDGSTGQVYVSPTPQELETLKGRVSRREKLIENVTGPGATKDGVPVALLANIGTFEDARIAAGTEVEGVGLFRTEFLYLDRPTAPSRSDQVAAYRQILSGFVGRTITVRTLDAGADKPLQFAAQYREANPALGRRGIRLSRSRSDLLDDQLAALAEAGAELSVELNVMAPMVATVEEALWFFERAKKHALPSVGVMIEVPGAALRAEAISRVVDFISIGTNDLSQYTMAADRLDGSMADLLSPWQPALLELINLACQGAVATGTPISVCGEAAADPALALVLAGMGVRSLSMAPGRIGAVRAALSRHTLEQCQELAAVALDAAGPAEARSRVIAAADRMLAALL